MLVGARVLKTGIAVAISMYICYFLDIQPAIFAGAATVVNLQPSVVQSLRNAKNQILVHFLSIGIAIILGLVLVPNPLTMGLSAVIIITICTKLGFQKSISMGVVASIFILDSPPTQFLDHALIRSLAIFIGLGTALVVNTAIAPPHYHERLMDKLKEINTAISEAFQAAINSYIYLEALPENWPEKKKVLKNLLKEGENLYMLYSFEVGQRNPKDQQIQNKTLLLYKEYLAYNKGLIQRTSDINFLVQERKERRTEAGDLPISEDFQQILNLLKDVINLYSFYNRTLTDKLDTGESIVYEPPLIWHRIDVLLNEWYDRFPANSYYLHALIEVSLITYKIDWATNEAIRLLGSELD